MRPILHYQEERRAKTNFYASDAGKLGIDIILSLKNTPESDPSPWNSTLRMAAGKGVELQMIKVLKSNNIIEQDFDQDSEPSTVIEREGVKISMRFDARVKAGGAKLFLQELNLPQGKSIELGEGEPIEIKSINNKNAMDIASYTNGIPRESYVMQLAIYMDALSKEQGHLFVSSVDGLSFFWFTCHKVSEGVYKCGETVVDIGKEYKRFAEIAKAAQAVPTVYDVLKDCFSTEKTLQKYWFEEVYKLPVEQIDFTKVSDTKIKEARMNRYVIGTEGKYKIDYSAFKRYILAAQEAVPGYTEKEVEFIKEKTAGYTSKKA